MPGSRTVAQCREQREQRGLTEDERRAVVDEALVLIEELYVHLPQKRAAHASDPAQRLRLVRDRIPEWSETRFHDELAAVFAELHDLHTSYLPPAAEGGLAVLPVLVEQFTDEAGAPRYVVSGIDPEQDPDQATVGAEVTHWNGTPIERLVESGAGGTAGSNPAARRVQFRLMMTVRPLALLPLPDEEWVDITYRVGTEVGQIRLPWVVLPPAAPAAPPRDTSPVAGPAGVIGMSLQVQQQRAAVQRLFAPAGLLARPKDRAGETPVDSTRPELAARVVRTAYGEFGHLRIFSFLLDAPDGDVLAAIDDFAAEVRRLLAVLPQDGLVVDIRGNPGGYVLAAEGLLQLLSPHPIVPEPFQFRATRATAALSRTPGLGYEGWATSIEESLRTGAQHSGALPATPDEHANAAGQHYHGPVVLVTDATCYSAADILAAGFQDHSMGPVLGVDAATGAGGASVVARSAVGPLPGLREAWPDGPLSALPGGANFTVSLLRCLRVGARSGQPVEELGVVPDVVHALTRRDLLEGNPDLMEAAGALLAAGPPARRLTVDADGPGLAIRTAGLTSLDVYLDDRPVGTVTPTDGVSAVELPRPTGVVRIVGFDGAEMVASRRLTLR